MRFRLTIEIDVREPEALTAYAVAAYRAAFGDDTWLPENLGEAALEALVLSAPGPNADEIGIEIASTGAQAIGSARVGRP